MTTARKTIAEALLLAALYALVAKLSLALDAVEGFAALVWPPTGIALSVTILLGYRVWPGVALGAFAANFWQGAPAIAALGVAAGNTAEALLGAYLVRRAGFRLNFDRLSDVAAFVGFGALGAPIVSATVGPLSLWAAGVIAAHSLPATSFAWWSGDACGALVVGSLVLAWASPRSSALAPARAEELVPMVLLFVLAAVLPIFGSGASRAVVFIVFPLLIWASVRHGERGATASAAFVSASAVAWTALRVGPFVHGRLQEGLWTVQAYMAVMVVTLLVLGAVTEERARAVAALRRALDAREEFLSIASHELKTPLSAIVLHLSSLQRAFRTKESIDREGVERKTDRAMKQTERLTSLIGQLLDVSRISSGKFELTREDVDLGELSREICSRFSEEATRAGSSLSMRGARSLRGNWDRSRLEQVLSNLVSNAIRYGDGHPIDISLERRGASAVLVVRDEGPGIPADVLSRVFDRFTSSRAARRLGGLGLGLYIVRQIVEAHGGSIHAASTVGVGSTFTVELPCAEARPVLQSAP